LLAERDALRVLTAFSRTSDPRVRRAIARLVETVADLQPGLKLSGARRGSAIAGAANAGAAKRLARRRRTLGSPR
jgi:hypothetical protein